MIERVIQEGKAKRNRLSRRQAHELESYLVQHRESFESGRVDVFKAAENVSKEIGFEVSVQSLRSAARAMEVKISARKRRRASASNRPSTNAIVLLTGTVNELCKRLGVDIPVELIDIARDLHLKMEQCARVVTKPTVNGDKMPLFTR